MSLVQVIFYLLIHSCKRSLLLTANYFFDERRPMILEHCDIEIDPSKNAEFEKAILLGVETVIAKSQGFRGFKVNHSVETPARYLLMIYWDTLENHTIDFRGSDAFADWRNIVGPFFVKPPVVEHFNLIGKST